MKWKYHLVTLACLLGALYAYSASLTFGGALLGVGILLEGAFWMRLFKRPTKRRAHA